MGTLSLRRDRPIVSNSPRARRAPVPTQKLSHQKVASSHHRTTGSNLVSRRWSRGFIPPVTRRRILCRPCAAKSVLTKEGTSLCERRCANSNEHSRSQSQSSTKLERCQLNSSH